MTISQNEPISEARLYEVVHTATKDALQENWMIFGVNIESDQSVREQQRDFLWLRDRRENLMRASFVRGAVEKIGQAVIIIILTIAASTMHGKLFAF
jgi:hypothetical protein